MMNYLPDTVPDALIASRNRVPVLPPGAPYLLRSMSSEDVDLPCLADTLEKFPSIAARLIGLANSAWSSPASEITSLQQAVVRLGLDVVRSVSIGLAVAAPFDSKHCSSFDSERFWCSSLLTADAAGWLSPLLEAPSDVEANTARTAGLLHNLGLLWLADRMPLETHTALSAVDDEPNLRISDALREYCGIDYAQAGAYLAERWQLPEPLVISIAFHNDPGYNDQLWHSVRVVGSAESMVSSLYRETKGADEDAVQKPQAYELPMQHDQFNTIMERTAARFDSTRKLAHALFPSH